jgi:dynein heavy chain
MAVMIDDINMPLVEEYGAQPPIELLRLIADKKGFYDRKDWTWKRIVNTVLVACSAPPEGGRNNITTRFTRHFNILNLPQPSYDVLQKIFESMLKGFFETNGFPDVVRLSVGGIVAGTIDMYQDIIKEMKPIPAKFHYTFNLRDVSKVF